MAGKPGWVHVFCDGSVNPNPGPGGYAAILTAGKHRKGWDGEVSGYVPFTTSQRMELSAAIAGLGQLKGSRRCYVYSDSQYLIDGMHSGKVHAKYKLNSLHKVKNADLWADLVELDQFHQVEWVKIRKGEYENEEHRSNHTRVHDLANRAREQQEGSPWEEDLIPPRHDYSGEFVEEDSDDKEPAGAQVVDLSQRRNHRDERARLDRYHALLPLIDKKDAVKTPKGVGTLINAFSSECRVLLKGQPVTEGYGQGGTKNRYAPTTTFDTLDVQPV